MKVLAGIVLYNPEIGRLRQNINSIFPQIDKILCIDNGSVNIGEIKTEFGKKATIIENTYNKGIAAALNSIMNYAKCNGYDWFLTLDQDSVCMPELIENYKKHLDDARVAILSCAIQDRNFEDNAKKVQNIEDIEECITSASFCRTEALVKVGGFDEQMFIDGVDFDICKNLRNHGYKICKIGYVGLLHEVGHGRNVRLLWKKRVIYNHSFLRNYYMARNRLYLVKKYPGCYSMFKFWIKEFESELLILLYERHKIKKIKARHLGIKDAKKNNMGECKWL